MQDWEQAQTLHLEDSLTLLDVVKQLSQDSHSPAILDVGSGAGFPGVVLAIAEPDWKVCQGFSSNLSVFCWQKTNNPRGLAGDLAGFGSKEVQFRERKHAGLTTQQCHICMGQSRESCTI